MLYLNKTTFTRTNQEMERGRTEDNNDAEKSGHEVTLFLAADGVHILNCKSAGEIVGQGTGDLYEHLESLKNTNATIFVSGMSAKARGYDETLLDGYKAEFAMPDKLVEESIKSDSVLCY